MISFVLFPQTSQPSMNFHISEYWSIGVGLVSGQFHYRLLIQAYFWPIESVNQSQWCYHSNKTSQQYSHDQIAWLKKKKQKTKQNCVKTPYFCRRKISLYNFLCVKVTLVFKLTVVFKLHLSKIKRFCKFFLYQPNIIAGFSPYKYSPAEDLYVIF